MSTVLRRGLAALVSVTTTVGLAVVAPAAHAAAPSSTVLAVDGTTVGEAFDNMGNVGVMEEADAEEEKAE